MNPNVINNIQSKISSTEETLNFYSDIFKEFNKVFVTFQKSMQGFLKAEKELAEFLSEKSLKLSKIDISLCMYFFYFYRYIYIFFF